MTLGILDLGKTLQGDDQNVRIIAVFKFSKLHMKIFAFSGVEINFFCYLQIIASAMISNMLNASCYSENERYDFLLYYCQYH